MMMMMYSMMMGTSAAKAKEEESAEHSQEARPVKTETKEELRQKAKQPPLN